jgi:hypothetical protein
MPELGTQQRNPYKRMPAPAIPFPPPSAQPSMKEESTTQDRSSMNERQHEENDFR